MSNNGAPGDANLSNRSRARATDKAGAAGPALADEMLYCERCGISFLWTVEERMPREGARAPAGEARPPIVDTQERPPRYCPGCRALLPQPARERGLVKWYNIRKRYGFVVRQNQPDIFVPAASLRGARFLQSGDLVEFSVGSNAEGPIAEDVRVLRGA